MKKNLLAEQPNPETIQVEKTLKRLPGGINICYYENDLTFYYMNQEYQDLIGYSEEEIEVLFHNNKLLTVYEEDREDMKADLNRQLGESKDYEITYRVHTRANKLVWVIEKGKLVDDAEGGTFIYSVLFNINALKYHSEYDVLTGTINIEHFYTSAATVIKRDIFKKFAIIVFDIDKFKLVNDLYGFEEGNNVLRYIADILNKLLGTDHLYSRMNSDNFCMLMDYKRENELVMLISRITSEIYKCSADYEVKPSFGIYRITERDVPIRIMCDWANMAKQTIKGNLLQFFAYYNNTLRMEILEAKEIEVEMGSALSNNQFQMYLQPKYNIDEEKIVGAEALVRWIHPEKGIIPPTKFIPLFEKNGFVVALDEHIWEETCKALRKWIDSGLPIVPISVNVSRVHLLDSKFYTTITNLVDRYNLPRNLVELEVTESTFFENEMQVNNYFQELKGAGFTLAMDDFGAGYSSLNMLQEIPIDIIKIDRGFLKETATTKRGQVIIKHTIAMAKELDLEVLAEGVETKGQAEFLSAAGCKMAQGYYYSKPITMDEFEVLLANREKVSGIL